MALARSPAPALEQKGFGFSKKGEQLVFYGYFLGFFHHFQVFYGYFLGFVEGKQAKTQKMLSSWCNSSHQMLESSAHYVSLLNSMATWPAKEERSLVRTNAQNPT